MREEEKTINKYKEQGRGTKKKHQLAPEPDKYEIDEKKMIGSPDMMTAREKSIYTVNAMARRSAFFSFFALLILPFGGLLVFGFAYMVYANYMIGDVMTKMVDTFYRPFEVWTFGITFALLVISGFVIKLVFSDKRGLIIRANDKMVEEGLEPVVIPRRDGDKNRLIEAFYKIKPPYFVFYPVLVICLALLIWCGFNVWSTAARQKVITDNARKDACELVERSYKGYKVKSSHVVMAFDDRYTFKIGDHVTSILDIDENGKVLDASHMLRYYGKFKYKDVEKLGSKGILKLMSDIHKKSSGYKELFVYPEVTDVPMKFSDYMINYIDNIREKSSWSKGYEYKVGNHTYITHCKVSYSEGKDKKSKDDDVMRVNYEIQQKNFKRTNW